MSTSPEYTSHRLPAVGMAVEATYNVLYAGLAVASVRLPTQPAAEISLSGGIRPLNLTEQESDDLVSFMEALTSPEYAALPSAARMEVKP